MTTSSVIPTLFRNPWDTRRGTANGIASASETRSPDSATPVSLSLEVVKGIWRRYPSLDRNKPITASPSTAQHSNALELNLGMQSQEDITTSTRMSQHQSMGDPSGTSGEASVSIDSPTSELAVDELVPTVSDNMDITPAPVSKSLPSDMGGGSAPHVDPELPPGRHLDAHGPPSSSSQLDTRIRSMAEVRAALMDSLLKTAQIRNPNQDIDLAKLGERFSQKLSDTVVQDFVHMGKEVMDQLRSFGKLEEVKRKYSSGRRDEDGEDERRTRRRVDESASPDAVDASRTLILDGRDNSRGPESVTPAQSEKSIRGITPKAPRAMLTKLRDTPPRWPSSQASRRGSTVTPRQGKRDELGQEPLRPGYDTQDDVSMSIDSPSPRPALAPSRISQPLNAHSDLNASANQVHSQSSPNRLEGQPNSTAQPGTSLLPGVTLGSAKILLAKVGLPSGDILDASFDLDEELVAAARRWAQRSKHFDPTVLHMRLCLTSIPTTAAETAHRDLPPNHPPSLLANAVSQIPVEWPQHGTYYVSLNRGRPEAMSWGDHFFTPSSPPLDLSNVVIPGQNVIQFVQLADHSQQLFVILAIPPSEAEKQDVLAMQSRRSAWNHISDNYKPKTGGKLQFDSFSL